MELMPLKSYKAPEYPVLQDFKSNRSMIFEYQPERWKLKKAVATAMIALAFGVGEGCSTTTIIPKVKLVKVLGSTNENPDNGNNRQVRNSVIAPVFLHGDGRGIFGCVVVNGPVFMSEEDAKEIIENEFNKRGIKLTNGIEVKEIYSTQYSSYEKDGKTILRYNL